MFSRDQKGQNLNPIQHGQYSQLCQNQADLLSPIITVAVIGGGLGILDG
jgi:hypothetical protein